MTVILTLMAWSSVPLFLEHFTIQIDGWTSNGWRYGFSALLWLPVLIIGAARRRLPRGLFVAALVPSLVNAAGQVTFVWTFYKIEPGLLTFGLRSQMVFVAVAAYIMFPPERPIIRSRGYLLGLLAMAIGTAAAVLLGDEPIRDAHAFGIILALATGALWAGYGVTVRKFMTGMNSIVAFAAISLYTAVVMVGLMLILGDKRGGTALDMPATQFTLLLLSSVIGIALGHVLYYTSIARLGVAVSSGVLQLHPFIVAVASLALFGEHLTAWQWTGGVIAVGGAILMLSVQRRSVRSRVTGNPAAPAGDAGEEG
ncbi:MAG: DMT family transporter [Planctomycetota bacterium]